MCDFCLKNNYIVGSLQCFCNKNFCENCEGILGTTVCDICDKNFICEKHCDLSFLKNGELFLSKKDQTEKILQNKNFNSSKQISNENCKRICLKCQFNI